jgi:hypothetical protein
MVNKEQVSQYLRQHVKLVLDGNFVLTGEILGVYDDSITFKTKQSTSLITYNRIWEITPTNRRNVF